MHCVGQYPTQIDSLELNQIDYLKKRYKDIPIGFSTHEDPDNYDSVMLAIAKGAELFEKHVALETEKYPRNAYSVNPEEMREWLRRASSAIKMCGEGGSRYFPSDKELADLGQFKRGVFAKTRIEEGETIDRSNVYYAWPAQEDQVLANDMSKYTHYVATHTFEPNDPIIHTHHKWKDDCDQVKKVETRESILKIVQDVKWFLQRSAVVFPGKAQLEISHHYGVDKFYETGISMITVVNREYCKKLIIVLPKQNHPEQYHKQKEETFVVLHGSVSLYLDGTLHVLEKGDVITIEPKVRHSFSSKEGCVIEEVSSTHYVDDSYYNHGIYSMGWSYKGYTLGNSFINHLEVEPTEVFHIGISGKLLSNYQYKIKASRRININNLVQYKLIFGKIIDNKTKKEIPAFNIVIANNESGENRIGIGIYWEL